MKRYIYYFLKDVNNNEYKINTENFSIRIFTGDLSKLELEYRLLGIRAHDIYIDKSFLNSDYLDLIKHIPIMNYGKGIEFIEKPVFPVEIDIW